MDKDETEMTISGFAGSGKTFLMSYLYKISEKIHDFARIMEEDLPKRKIFFTATTNKAAHVLEQTLNKALPDSEIEVTTIHRLLSLQVKNNNKTGQQELTINRNSYSKDIANSIIFIDEASMINRELLHYIRKQVKDRPNVKVVFVGDEYQLPPVREDICPVFKRAPYIVSLKEIQRQVADHPIIQLSEKYRNCLDDHTLSWPEIQPADSRIICYQNKHDFFHAIVQDFQSHTHNLYHAKILAWSNKRVREYNNWMRRMFGYPEEYTTGEHIVTNRPLIKLGSERILAPTDSIHKIYRVYPAEREVSGYLISLEGVPGQFFHPKCWDEAEKIAQQYRKDAYKTKNWAPYWNIKQMWVDFRPLYASTVHKAQGSTYNNVFVDLNNIGKNNNWREVARLTYVAITRASHQVHIYGELKERYNRAPVVDIMEDFKNVKCLAV
jgi:hypothetical protein